MDGMEAVDADAMAVVKALVQVVDVGQRLVGTAGIPQEVREVEVHSSKAAVDRVH